MEVEARIENKDIGFVSVGQPVEIKVETFLFTRYGLIEGKVRTISQDALQMENGALVYAAAVTMAKSSMVVDGNEVALSPGMNVTVEIKTGQRRLIEYFLSPLMQAKQESLRER
jgi:hemolysin D